jgi:hypothetical protein
MATRFESIHLPHLIDAAPDVPERVRQSAAHYGDLARFASQVEAGRARTTPVACPRRPGRKPCGGLLVVEWQEAAAQVDWHCPECRAAGVITGWMGTQADLRDVRRRPRLGLREVAVTVEAHAALRDAARQDPELEHLAFTSQVGADGQPVLYVRDEERAPYQLRLTANALRMGNTRAADRLMTIVEALGGSPAERAGAPGLVELQGDDVPNLLQALLDQADVRPPEFVFRNARGRQTRIRPLRRSPPQTLQIKLTLRDVRPPVWRRLLVPGDIRLPRLHTILQVAMGWSDCHLHLFRSGDVCYAPPGDWDSVGEDSRRVALVDLAARPGAKLVYEYDFGDGWMHDILVESVTPEPCKVARCIAGRRRCPPEDCGGPWGYGEFLHAMANSAHERHAELREWRRERFDPAEFDVDDTNDAVGRIALR